MSRHRSRLRPYRLLAFATLFGVALAASWKYGWLPVEFGNPEMGTLDDQEVDLTDYKTATGQNELALLNGGNVDPEIFESQSEPIVDAGSARSNEYSSGSMHSWLNSNAERPDDGPSFASDAGERETPVASGQVQQASNETTSQAQQQTATASRAKRETPTRAASADLRKQLVEIDDLLQQGKDVAAHRQLSRIYWKNPLSRARIQKKIERTARSIYFSPQPHYMEPYVIRPGDQLRTVAKTYRITWPYLAKLNRIDPRRIRAGQKLKVIKGPFSAFVDLSDFELIVHAHGYFVKRYRIGIGKDGSSPIGKFRVLNKVTNPQYTDPQGRVIDGDDPKNPLGEHWIDIGDGFGIHGTLNPNSIGSDQSRGCIRLLNSDIAEVHDLLDIGSEVLIRR